MPPRPARRRYRREQRLEGEEEREGVVMAVAAVVEAGKKSYSSAHNSNSGLARNSKSTPALACIHAAAFLRDWDDHNHSLQMHRCLPPRALFGYTYPRHNVLLKDENHDVANVNVDRPSPRDLAPCHLHVTHEDRMLRPQRQLLHLVGFLDGFMESSMNSMLKQA